MRRALIGHTGFVGGNLRAQGSYTDCFNSKNFQQMRGEAYDEVVCAGVSAVKWKANKEPEADRAGIAALEAVLNEVEAARFVLISTIDVYPVITGEDEAYDCQAQPNHAYGTHRLAFEAFCAQRFADCRVIRLPGLFGTGLKKNVIFDLLHDNCLEMINPASSFQYYDLSALTEDIERVVQSALTLVNFFTEPVPTADILQRFFPEAKVGAEPVGEAHYDLRTRHAELWGRTGPYIASREEMLERIEAFIQRQRASNPPR
ncbi:MAG: NAD(P)-dependent oxidoreductase [Opitutales bacterium]